MSTSNNPTSQWVISNAAQPDSYLPHNLPNEIFDALSSELAEYQLQPDQENVIEGLVAVTMGLIGAQGITQTSHEEITQGLQQYIKIFSIERLKRSGIVTSYSEPTLKSIFDENLALDITFDEELLQKSPEIAKKLFKML